MFHLRLMKFWILVVACIFTIRIKDYTVKADEIQKAQNFLNQYNQEFGNGIYEYETAAFNFRTNNNDANRINLIAIEAKFENFKGRFAKNASAFNLKMLQGRPEIVRQLSLIKNGGILLDIKDGKLLGELKSEMIRLHEMATMCGWTKEKGKNWKENCSDRWHFDAAQSPFLIEKSNEERLKKVWESIRTVFGAPNKSSFEKMVNLLNKGASAAGFKNYADFLKAPYEDNNFEATVEKLWHQVLPFYENLHTFVRRKLSKLHNRRFVGAHPIPAHLTSNPISGSFKFLYLFKFQIQANATFQYGDLMAEVMPIVYKPDNAEVKLADEFYQSMGLEPMPQSFYQKSIFRTPMDEPFKYCWTQVFNFYKNRDVRIKFCGMDLVNTYAASIGYCLYCLSYEKQPMAFRRAANPTLYHSIGSAIHLAMNVPEYWQAIGLLRTYRRNEMQDLDFLFFQAMKKFSDLPFYYVVDKWRYGVFSGKYPDEKWQEAFWNLTFRYQGLSSPVPRTKNEFDPGVIVNVVGNEPMLYNHIISQIVQFQIFKALCKTAGYEGPLHHCVLYKNKKVGKVLSDAMKLGASKPWPEVMQVLTGKREMDATGLLEYFKPLVDWLTKENQDASDCYGWSSEKWPDHVESTLLKPRCK